MKLTFEVLGRRHLDWLRNLRNENRGWFLDSREVNAIDEGLWFRYSTDTGDLNLVLKDGEERIGFISIYNTSGGGAVVGRMMVESKHKRKGYMEKALINIFDICRRYLGIEELRLEVKKENLPARDLYCKLGFLTFGITQETLIMRKML